MKRESYENLVRSAKGVPIVKVRTKWGDVLVAEEFKNDNLVEFPFGYYRMMWAIERDGMDFAQELFFDAFHDTSIPFADKQRARTNAALLNAQGWLETNIKSGRYDA